MNTRRLIFLLVLGTFPLRAATVAVRPQATVSGEVVRLSDITEPDSEVPEAVRRLIIAAAPALGGTTVIGGPEIRDRLDGNGWQAITLTGAPKVRVERRGRQVDGSFFVPILRRFLVEHTPWGGEARIEVTMSRPLVIPEGDLEWQVIPPVGENCLGALLVQVKGLAAGEEVFSDWLSARVRVEWTVAVSNRLLPKEQPIAAEDIRWERREITPAIAGALRSQEAVLGRRPVRGIPAGSVITTALIGEETLVRRGAPVTLQAAGRGITVSLPAKALEDGRRGDRVRVLNPASQRVVLAEVVGPGQLSVRVE